jgi:predicted DCC family thiol-disulfide oxidoreductase YuxK
LAAHAIIFFDGVCNLCNGFVDYIIRHDKKGYFLFTSLQSQKAGEMLKPFHMEATVSEGVILLENGRLYFRSEAGLRILKRLSGMHRLLYFFIIVPRFIRDKVYDFIASNRYRWFGKKEQCRIPEPGERERFVE